MQPDAWCCGASTIDSDSQQECLPQVAPPPTANQLAIHWLTLRFADARIERKICAQLTQSSYLMNMCVFGLEIAQHIAISTWRPALSTVGAIYIPTCMMFLLAQWFSQRRNATGAYERSQWIWLSLSLFSTTIQRVTFVVGLHPFLTVEESHIATMYHFSWGMIAVILHMQLISFEVRMIILGAAWLSLATVNWDDEHRGWTYNGQPADTINITVALSMGELVGYFAERSIRENFAKDYSETEVLRMRLHEDEELLDELANEVWAQQLLDHNTRSRAPQCVAANPPDHKQHELRAAAAIRPLTDTPKMA